MGFMSNSNNLPKEIKVPWYKNGIMMANRSFLPPSHPESEYNYIKNVLGLPPEEYGVFGEYEIVAQELREKTREDLILQIIEMRKELDNLYKHF